MLHFTQISKIKIKLPTQQLMELGVGSKKHGTLLLVGLRKHGILLLVGLREPGMRRQAGSLPCLVLQPNSTKKLKVSHSPNQTL